MLAIVPARGGSKQVPRKNLRVVNGKPLLVHTIHTLQHVPEIKKVCVSTDDLEIAGIAKMHGCLVVDRPAELATDDATVGQVAAHAVAHFDWGGTVGVFQPTSPTLTAQTISAAIREFDKGFVSLHSVVPESHYLWDGDIPLAAEGRVNRQYREPYWRETGGIQLARTCPVGPMDPLVGHPHRLFPIPPEEGIDIDSAADLQAAERVLACKQVEFRICASQRLGAGHLYRALQLADDLAHHDVQFVWSRRIEPWAWDRIKDRGYDGGPRADPDVVVFDRLDTSAEEVCALKAQGVKVVTLEDLGTGSGYADLTVNELYRDDRPHVVSGPKWAVLRPEFLCAPPFPMTNKRRVLVLFGGTDAGRVAERVARRASLHGQVRVVLGPAAPEPDLRGVAAEVVRDAHVAYELRHCDLLVTSAGRAVHEAAALGVPTISVAVNERESRHSHCDGVIRLGLAQAVSDDQISGAVNRVLGDVGLREEMSATSRAAVDGLGSRRISHAIDGILADL